MGRLAVLLLLNSAVGELPPNCRTAKKQVQALWKRSVYGPRESERVYCPLRQDPIDHLQASFESIAGQANALKTVRAALMKNVRLGRGPLVMHIAGPSGVGKSLTARSVARAVMEDTASEGGADWCGVSVINGHYYSSRDMARIQSDSRAIMEQIGSQLQVCPRSVVILEDIQHMHEALLQSLATAFDDAFPHVHISASAAQPEEKAAEKQTSMSPVAAKKEKNAYEVSTAAAIFVLVSDLGEESLDPNMGREMAKMAVRNATRKHWPSAKLPKFVHEIVPFLPLNEEEMALVAEFELRKYRDELQRENIFTIGDEPWGGVLSWTPEVPAHISRQVRSHDFLHEIQGRGVQQHVQTVVDNAWDLREEAGDMGLFDNLHLEVVDSAITSIADRVVGDDEYNRNGQHHGVRDLR